MATKVRVVLNDAGVKELLKSDEVQEACIQAAGAVASAAGGEGYETGYAFTQVRAGALVETTTAAAYRERNKLLKALGSVIPARKFH